MRLFTYGPNPVCDDLRGGSLRALRNGTSRTFGSDNSAIWYYDGDAYMLYLDLDRDPIVVNHNTTSVISLGSTFRANDTIIHVGWRKDARTSRSTEHIWKECDKPMPLYNNDPDMAAVNTSIAVTMNARTYIAAPVSNCGGQTRETLEICTVVFIAGDYTFSATGEGCLYGRAASRGIQPDTIFAYDPREGRPTHLYHDPQMPYWDRIFDVPNGMILHRSVPIGNRAPDPEGYRTVELFDYRACALIGTGVMLEINQVLFFIYAGAMLQYTNAQNLDR